MHSLYTGFIRLLPLTNCNLFWAIQEIDIQIQEFSAIHICDQYFLLLNTQKIIKLLAIKIKIKIM